jgi:Cu-processing system permease protein
MSVVWCLALNTYREVVRDRILYGLLLFALMLIVLSLALGQLSFAEQARISTNFGLAAMHLSAVALAIFIGGHLIYKELERKTILTILVRPISRLQFLFGKALGLSLVLFVMILGLMAVMSFVLYVLGSSPSWMLLWIGVGLFFECLVLLGWTLFLSTFLKPLLAISCTVGLFLIGHWQSSLRFFADKADSGLLPVVATIVRYTVPDLERVDWKAFMIYPEGWQNSAALWSILYCFAWFVTLILLARLVFERKDVG